MGSRPSSMSPGEDNLLAFSFPKEAEMSDVAVKNYQLLHLMRYSQGLDAMAKMFSSDLRINGLLGVTFDLAAANKILAVLAGQFGVILVQVLRRLCEVA